MHNLTQLDTKTWILKIKYRWKFIIKRLSDVPYRNTVSFLYKINYIIWEYKYLCFHEINLEFSDSFSPFFLKQKIQNHNSTMYLL